MMGNRAFLRSNSLLLTMCGLVNVNKIDQFSSNSSRMNTVPRLVCPRAPRRVQVGSILVPYRQDSFEKYSKDVDSSWKRANESRTQIKGGATPRRNLLRANSFSESIRAWPTTNKIAIPASRPEFLQTSNKRGGRETFWLQLYCRKVVDPS